MSNATKSFDILAISLSVHNYFDSPTKLFSDLHLHKFLETLAKPFFPCGEKTSNVQKFSKFAYDTSDLKQHDLACDTT